MKAVGIVKIDGKLYEPYFKENKIYHFCGACKLYSQCPVLETDDECLINHNLTYGKWYDCSLVMPEDFEELVEEDSYIAWVLVGDINLPREHYSDSRIKKDDKWYWAVNKIENITHWMVIPKLEE